MADENRKSCFESCVADLALETKGVCATTVTTPPQHRCSGPSCSATWTPAASRRLHYTRLARAHRLQSAVVDTFLRSEDDRQRLIESVAEVHIQPRIAAAQSLQTAYERGELLDAIRLFDLAKARHASCIAALMARRNRFARCSCSTHA